MFSLSSDRLTLPEDKFSTNLDNFLQGLRPIVEKYEERQRGRMELGLNVFTIISDYYYRETFHGDILYAILSPDAGHREGNLYVNLFIDMINLERKTDKIGYYDKVSVQKEFGTNDGKNAGRIDLLIIGEVKGKVHCIIIENKLHNAADTYQQLPKYYNDLNSKYTIDAFVYLPLDPNKKPETTNWDESVKKIIEDKLVIIPAYAPKRVNLIDNWLDPAEKKTTNTDARFIIRHYISLLNNLTIDIMDNSELANLCIENKNFDATMAILENSSTICCAIIEDFIRRLKETIEEQNLGEISEAGSKKIVIKINDHWSYIIEYYPYSRQYWRALSYSGNNELPHVVEQIWGKKEKGYPFGWDYFDEKKGWCFWDRPSTLRALHQNEFIVFIVDELKKSKEAIAKLNMNIADSGMDVSAAAQ